MKHYKHVPPALPPVWMPPWVASFIELAAPVVGWELGNWILRILRDS